MRANTFDAATNTLTIDPARAKAFEANQKYYADVFSNGNTDYAIPKGAQTDPAKLRELGSFFFWTAWAAAANRPGDTITYTSNWPHEPLVGNVPPASRRLDRRQHHHAAGGHRRYGLVLRRAAARRAGGSARDGSDSRMGRHSVAGRDVKYFVVVAALILVQMLIGAVTAHYGVEGDGFYGIPLSRLLPYSVTRTWHVQIGLFWIATAWLAAGLFIGPLVSGKEPKGQRLGVNVLFVALLIVVVGSLAGEWLSVHNRMTETNSFYFGHRATSTSISAASGRSPCSSACCSGCS